MYTVCSDNVLKVKSLASSGRWRWQRRSIWRDEVDVPGETRRDVFPNPCQARKAVGLRFHLQPRLATIANPISLYFKIASRCFIVDT